MAFERDKLALNSAGFSAVPNLYGYGITNDDVATVIAADYFLAAAGDLKIGDMIMVVSDNVSPLPGAILIVQTLVLDTDGIPTSITVSQLV